MSTDPNIIYHHYLIWKTKLLTESDPQSAKQFADLHSTTIEALLDFEQRPTFSDDILAYSLNWLSKKMPELLHLAFIEAKRNKSVQDIQRLIELSNDLKRKRDDNRSMTQYNFFNSNVSEQQFREIIERTAGSLKAGSPPQTP